jgi:hypothetical protein
MRRRSSLAVYLAKSGVPDRAKVEMTEALRLKPNDGTIVLKSVLSSRAKSRS